MAQSVTAGDLSGLNVILTGLDVYPKTVDITVRDYITGEEYSTYKSVPVSGDTIHLGSPAVDSLIRRA
ncbi:hypothetical protein H6768_06350 [Candidatus Peribacteria bacterium]|nr:hypothetical protein [Candidatus Peribacteria bacterium]